jgi:hypothetical protein
MLPKSVIPLRRLNKFVLLVVFFTSCSNWAAAASTAANNVGGGSLDDWLALGLAALAALYCVQKRE